MRTMRRAVGWGLVAVLLGWMGLTHVAQAAELTFWSQWAPQENKKAVVVEGKRRFEAKHPGDTVTITYWEKQNMWPALRGAFMAGSGFPDVFYFDTDVPEFIEAGWMADLSNGIRWENVEPFAKAFWTVPGPGGKMGTWAFPIEAQVDELYFNKKMFQQLNITVPANYAFTQDEFKQVVAKCTTAGYAGFATGMANREWPALYPITMLLLSKLGGEDVKRLGRGELSWKDPRVVEVFRYYKELIDLGLYSKSLSSMTLAEGDTYFHTAQKACMYPVGGSYTGRAFIPPEKGGQPKDFELGILNYPLMKDGTGHRQKFISIAGTFAAAAKSPNLPLAVELLDAYADVEVGNMWMSLVGMKPGIKTAPARMKSPIQWYWEEQAKVNNGTIWVDTRTEDLRLLMGPRIWQVWVATVGQGLPNKLIGPDEALAKMEEARAKGK